MLVGNQTLLGLDQLVLMALVYVKCGILLRRLHDALFSKIPLVREIVRAAILPPLCFERGGLLLLLLDFIQP